jgi:hypothetical protein
VICIDDERKEAYSQVLGKLTGTSSNLSVTAAPTAPPLTPNQPLPPSAPVPAKAAAPVLARHESHEDDLGFDLFG